MEISENIKKLRKSLSMTQKELAESTGLSIGTIQGYEQGKYEPKLEALRLLTESLGCSYSDIIDEPIDIDGSLSHIYWLLDDNIPSEKYEDLINYFNELNSTGQNKALEQLELLAKIPEYLKK